MAQASATLHEAAEHLSQRTIDMHRATVSLQEELEAADWYRQRADACNDAALRDILLHHMREEIEHAAMLIEWLRRHEENFREQLATYLDSSGAITEIEEAHEAEEALEKVATGEIPPDSRPAEPAGLTRADAEGFTVGPLKARSGR
jgi:hypothetical protein